LMAYLLLRRRPLDSTDIVVVAAALIQGWHLAWAIFRDSGSTKSFIFSRPFSRARLFRSRWSLGIALQAITLAAVFALVAIGARTYVHRTTLPFYPMVQWYELSVLWPLSVVSLLAFHAQMFLMLKGQLTRPAPASKWTSAAALTLPCALVVLLIFAHMYASSGGAGLPPRLVLAAAVYLATLVAATTLASLHLYRHMEIEP
ncbi:MAG: hypothetical protein JSU94_08290, partial [Phycisphaerales bacterium]